MPEAGVPGLLGAGLIGLVVGLLVGAVIALAIRRRSGTSQKEIERLKEEHERYRAEVDQHFARTSALFGEVTERYRDLYEHMATGAQRLCRDQLQQPALDIPDKGLIGEDESAPGTEAPRAAEESGRRTGGDRPAETEEEQT